MYLALLIRLFVWRSHPLTEDDVRRRLEAEAKRKQEAEWKTRALIESLQTRAGRRVTFEWEESFDFDAVVKIQGTITDWLEVRPCCDGRVVGGGRPMIIIICPSSSFLLITVDCQSVMSSA